MKIFDEECLRSTLQIATPSSCTCEHDRILDGFYVSFMDFGIPNEVLHGSCCEMKDEQCF